MPNPIKYSTGSETLALKKGNFYIGTGDVGKGPSDTTGYYNGVSPSSGGYVIYMNKTGAPGNLSYHNAPTDEALISFTNNLAGQSYTGVNQCLTYFAGQTDKVCVNRDYEGIVTDGLVLNVDAGFTPSYPTSGTTWYDISTGGNNGTLTNGPTFNSDNGGSIVFDGVDDLVICSASLQNATAFTIGIWLYNTDTNINYVMSQQPLASDGVNAHNQYSVESGKSFFTVYGATGNAYDNYYDVTPTFTTGSWFYQIYQWDSSHTMKMFLNGVQQSGTYNFSGTRPTSILNSFPFRIGLGGRSGLTGALFYFKGNISITQVYNRVLTPSEILQNYNAQKGRFGL